MDGIRNNIDWTKELNHYVQKLSQNWDIIRKFSSSKHHSLIIIIYSVRQQLITFKLLSFTPQLLIQQPGNMLYKNRHIIKHLCGKSNISSYIKILQLHSQLYNKIMTSTIKNTDKFSHKETIKSQWKLYYCI